MKKAPDDLNAPDPAPEEAGSQIGAPMQPKLSLEGFVDKKFLSNLERCLEEIRMGKFSQTGNFEEPMASLPPKKLDFSELYSPKRRIKPDYLQKIRQLEPNVPNKFLEQYLAPDILSGEPLPKFPEDGHEPEVVAEDTSQELRAEIAAKQAAREAELFQYHGAILPQGIILPKILKEDKIHDPLSRKALAIPPLKPSAIESAGLDPELQQALDEVIAFAKAKLRSLSEEKPLAEKDPSLKLSFNEPKILFNDYLMKKYINPEKK